MHKTIPFKSISRVDCNLWNRLESTIKILVLLIFHSILLHEDGVLGILKHAKMSIG